MQTLKLSALVFATLTLTLTGCGDDDPDPMTMVDAGTPGDCHTAGAIVATGMCASDSDLTGTCADYSGSGIADIASTCGVGCLTNPDQGACTTMCILAQTSNGVSTDCANCYTASVGCAAMNCLTECAADPAGAACLACRCGTNTAMVNCIDVFTACSGIPSDTCAGM